MYSVRNVFKLRQMPKQKKQKKLQIIYNNLPGSVYKCHINVSVLSADADSSFKYFPRPACTITMIFTS